MFNIKFWSCVFLLKFFVISYICLFEDCVVCLFEIKIEGMVVCVVYLKYICMLLIWLFDFVKNF